MNRLADESSPYLLQHAGNPVDWYPWGDEAFARARDEDKPVLLSVGYAACHWCHVMERESFEDDETAALMNERFVCVKVDREERPDVDGLYMEAVVAIAGHGGWPMTVFLDPAGKPFFGGTYYPPEPRHGLPGFRQVLLAVSDAYANRRADLDRQAEALTDAIRQTGRLAPSTEPLTSGLLTGAVSALRRSFDPEEGGFGGAPKFPPASTLEFLLRQGSDEALAMVRTTLDKMAAGGMHDLVGGGFHRYSVDAVWLVPHFEKMLYDNAQLATAYLHGWVVLGEERWREVAERTLDYMVRELRLPEGGLAASQDADTDGVEGTTYTWTEEELGPELGGLLLPFEHGRSILRGELSDDVRARLLAVRDERPQPARDDKALAAWNGLALAAFAEAGRRLDRADYLEVANGIADFLAGRVDERGRLLRTEKIEGYLEDYGAVACGLVELYTATGDLRRLEEARRLALLAVELFEDPERGGFFVTPEESPLVARRKELDDNPTPSGNALLATALLHIARLWGDDDLERKAVGVLRIARPLIERAPAAVGQLLCVLDFHLAPPREIALVGENSELRAAALAGFEPNTVYAFASGPDDPAVDRVPLLAGKTLVDGKAAAYVCERFACRAPVTEPDGLTS